MGKPRVAFFDFTCCEGCQLQVANFGETLLDILGLIDVVMFREAMSDRVPAAILNREKVGFLPPERRWLEALEPWVTRTLSSPRFSRLPFLQPHVVRDAFAAQSTGRGFWPPHLWRILNLFWWIEFNHVEIAEE